MPWSLRCCGAIVLTYRHLLLHLKWAVHISTLGKLDKVLPSSNLTNLSHLNERNENHRLKSAGGKLVGDMSDSSDRSVEGNCIKLYQNTNSIGGGFKYFFIFTSIWGKIHPILTSIFFRWVGEKPPTRTSRFPVNTWIEKNSCFRNPDGFGQMIRWLDKIRYVPSGHKLNSVGVYMSIVRIPYIP